MSDCPLSSRCGGCALRNLNEEAYRSQKDASFKRIISRINQENITFGKPVFISDGTRRRASMAFCFIKKQLKLGFNTAQSHEIVDCEYCSLLTDKLNQNLPNVRRLLESVCSEPFRMKKGKKEIVQSMTDGDILLCEADNGIDILIKTDFEPQLTHRMVVSEQMSGYPDLIRLSWQSKKSKQPETLFEKTPPILVNSGVNVYVPAGTFLQASKAGEQALINLVLKYINGRGGTIADLFCGVGTFSYPLSQNRQNRILSIDSSVELLEGFKRSVNRNQIPNIQIETKNLFKYPLDEQELKNINVVVFDPPRAGAAAQVSKIAASGAPDVVIGVSCNPHTFVNDADTLIKGGYTLKEITMVDQFVYSGHTELVALFEKG